ncbi:hypothetical protein [Mastigocoleus sp. MO_188.B34]|uniref:hypothetical protein n=1 Tax=Mastigocoleus sp. MO_188.B34 TaxID=3036635 RepID=UPI00261880CC|nr:hypothetical protein [Mastigocoleus sp. MO_188.B34]MDJ0696933.1 hypothetical protein [Mastigocoleus sp. MO_188.B34]
MSNSGQLSQLQSKSPTLVELDDGSSIRVSDIGDKNRSAKAIVNFTGSNLVSLLSWNALPKIVNNSGINKKLELDKGIEVGDKGKKVTTEVWKSSFSLSEDFREDFLKELAELVPEEIFTGNVQSALIVRHISQPSKLGEGEWSLDLVANLVFFSHGDEVNRAISFNKKIFVRAIDTPALPNNPSEAQKVAYKVRKAGMEIFKIQDLKL